MDPTKFDMKYAAVRQMIIEQRFSHLNDKQREAVFKTEGPLLILAGAGSGKTTVLIQRIIHILKFGSGLNNPFAPVDATEDDLLFLAQYLADPLPENCEHAEELCAVSPPQPWEVIAITFTNKAARELRDRLRDALQDDKAASAVWAHTFHTACLRILRRHSELLGFAAAPTIYDDDDQKRIITGVLKKMNLSEQTFDVRSVLHTISRAKDQLQTPKKMREAAAGDFFLSTVADIYQEYQAELTHASALDFDDIIMKTVILLKKNPDVLERYQRQFRYVLVDEYQDTNYAQYVLISLLAGYYQNICVVGDDDQSIYKFRGATISNILEFEKQFQDAKTIRLEQNYRSTGNILQIANEVIRNNVYRKGKELWTVQEAGQKIRLHAALDQETEALYVAETIQEGVGKGRKYNDFAILYRNNVLSDNIVAALIQEQIPYRVYKGRDFFSRAEIRDMFAYLWLLENPADDLRLRRIINVPTRKIGEKSIETAAQLATRERLSLYEIISQASAYPELKRSAAAMERFSALIEELREQVATSTLSELYDLLLEKSGYFEMLALKKTAEAEGRIEHIQELKSYIVRYEQTNDAPTLTGFLEDMALYTDADQANEQEDAVLLMTMHAAKGLEFPVVFLVGLEKDLFPSFRAQQSSADLEEERRLCYVAITRAKEQLYLTYAQRRLLYGRFQYEQPSEFLNEMPQELLEMDMPIRNAPPLQGTPQRQGNGGNFSRRFADSEAKRISPMKQTVPPPDYTVGCRVRHKIFGEGTITAVLPMRNDLLIEVAFDKKGIRRFMASYTAKMIELIQENS